MKKNICLSVLISLVLVFAAGTGFAHDTGVKEDSGVKHDSLMKQDAGIKIVIPDEIAWKEGPSSLPGTKIAVIDGDPGKADIFTMRIKIPAGTKLAAHVHNNIERVTVISGTFNLAMGERADNPRVLPAGSYFSIPPKTVHNAWVDEDAVVQITTMGPWTFEPVKKGM